MLLAELCDRSIKSLEKWRKKGYYCFKFNDFFCWCACVCVSTDICSPKQELMCLAAKIILAKFNVMICEYCCFEAN